MIQIVLSYVLLGVIALAFGLFVLGHYWLALGVASLLPLVVWLCTRRCEQGFDLPDRAVKALSGSLPNTTNRAQQQVSPRSASAVFWLVIATFVAAQLLDSYAHSLIFDGFPYDGPFQSFNPMRRMDLGQWPLRDFFYFHGNLLPLLLYPFYWFLGQNLFAAEFGRHLLDLTSFLATAWIIGRGLFPQKQFRRLFYLVFLAVVLSNAVTTWLMNPIQGVHLTLVRVFPQVIAFVCGIAVAHRSEHSIRPALLWAMLGGAICTFVFLVATEHGAYLFVTLAATVLFFYRRPVWVRWILVATFGATFVGGLVAIEMTVSGHGPLSMMRNIMDDQMWYFGAYPNYFITRLSDLWENDGTFELVRGIGRLSIVTMIAGFFVWPALRTRRAESAGLFALLVYGLCASVSNLGYFGLHYFDPLVRALVIALVYFAFLGAIDWEVLRNRFGAQVFFGLRTALACERLNTFFLATAIIAILWGVAKPAAAWQMLSSSSKLQTDPTLGVRLPMEGQGAGSQWSHWVDAAITRSLVFGTNDASRLLGYGITAAGREGPFQGGIANLICLDLSEALPEGYGVGDFLRIYGEYWWLSSIGRDRRQACIGAYTQQQLALAARKFSGPQRTPVEVLAERRLEQGANPNTVLTDYYESGAYKLNGVYFDRPAVVLKPHGQRFGSRRGQLPQVGDVLVFAAAGARAVVAVFPTGYVELDRGGLDPYRDGYPRPIRVLKSLREPKQGTPIRATVSFSGAILLLPSAERWPRWVGEEVEFPFANQTLRVVSANAGKIFLSGFLEPVRHNELPRVHLFRRPGARISAFLHDRRRSAEKSRPTVWSTYTGIPDAIAGQMNPAGIDYIIHALGSERKRYLQEFRQQQPDYFVSMRSIPMPTYNLWLLTSNWALFKSVLANYQIAANSLHSIYWEKQSVPEDLKLGQEVGLSQQEKMTDTEVGCSKRSHEYFEADIRYRFGNRLASLPVLGKSPRAFIYPAGGFMGSPVSLSPYADRVQFPVLFVCGVGGGTIKAGVEGLGAGFSDLDVLSINVRRIENHREALDQMFGVSNEIRHTAAWSTTFGIDRPGSRPPVAE